MGKVRSSLQAKVTVLFLGIFLSITLIDLLIQSFILVPSFVKIEEHEAVKNLERIENTIDQEFDALKVTVWDLANWTDTYEYIQNHNRDYIEINFTDETIENYSIHLISFLNDKNEVVWAKIFDPEYDNTINLEDFSYTTFPPNHPAVTFEKTDAASTVYKTGVFNTEYGPLLFASTPILKSDSSGPSRGTLIIAKFLSASLIHKLNSQLRTPINLILPEEQNFQAININLGQSESGVYIESFEKDLHVYALYLDVNAKPAFIIETQYSREITESGFAAARFSLVMVILTSFAFLLLVFFIIRQAVLAPIATVTKFTKSINTEQDFSKRIPIHRADEIGALVEGINYMIATIERQTSLLMDMNASLRITSSTDGLTGIPNRRVFDELFTQLWNLHAREKQPLGLILGDVDHFKAYNDIYGHQKGDECLRMVALEIQKKITRSGDLAARYGGEEFVILLPNTDTKGVEVVAESIRKAIEHLNIPHVRSAVSTVVTISLGAGAVIPSSSLAPEEFFDTVDKMLYQSKKDGRNRVVAG